MSKEKNGNNIVRNFLLYAVPFLSVIFAVGMGYASLRKDVLINSESLHFNDLAIIEAKAKAQRNREDIITIQSDIKYIKSGVDDIKKMQMENGN